MLREDAELRKILLARSVECMLAGDVQIGKSLLRKYVNATLGFIALSEALGKSSKTLMQMLGPKGNPNIRNFFEIVAYLQKADGFELTVVNGDALKKATKGASRSKAKAPVHTHARKAA
jgi:DNA-binding phage protein